MEKYAHYSLFPDSRLHSEEEMLIEIRGLRRMFNAYQATANFTIRSPNGQLYEKPKEFILGVLKGNKFFLKDEAGGKSEVLHTADFSQVIGSWDEAIKREPYNCKHRENASPPSSASGGSVQICPNIDGACYATDLCRERGLHYENRRFGDKIPEPLSGLVERVLKEKL